MSSLEHNDFHMLDEIIAKLKKREFVGAETLRTMKLFRREEIAKYAESLVLRLDDAKESARLQAIHALGQHIIPRLDDDDECVRIATLRLLYELKPQVLLKLLYELKPQVLAKHAQHIIPSLVDDEWNVRGEAINALGGMESQVLARYAQHIIPRLCDEWPFFSRIIPRLGDDDQWVRRSALRALGNLEPEVLAMFAQLIIPKLDDDVQWVRIEAIKALGELEPQVLAKYAQHIIPRLGDDDAWVCNTAQATLEKLPLLALVPHRHALQYRLAKAASLRGRVWLVRWRQLFWVHMLLWYWGSQVWKPGSRQAIATGREFGQMQGGLAESEGEREVKRARGA